MFQVASQPTHFSMMDTYRPSYPTSVPPSVQLPRSLARPSFSEIPHDAVSSLAPELADVPMEYIRKHLAGQAHDMQTALSLLSIPTSLPKSRLPPTVEAPVRPVPNPPNSAAYPSHIIAISSSRSSPSSPSTPTVASFAAQSAMTGSMTVPLYPANALVLAAHCTLLPPLPRSRPSNKTAVVTLPVVPIAVPSVETYQFLHEYLHTKRPDNLLRSLLQPLATLIPNADAPSTSSTKAVYMSQFTSKHLYSLAQQLASLAYSRGGSQGAASPLMALARIVNGLWRNTCALGIFDPELWAVMDLAWEVILAALTHVAERDRV